MDRIDYAKIINWAGTATREIQTDEIPMYNVGDIINPGLCWTDNGTFCVENENKYSTVFYITENIEGHKVNYEDEDECWDLSCEGCEHEDEVLINQDFEIVEFWKYDEETKFAQVYLKPVTKKLAK